MARPRKINGNGNKPQAVTPMVDMPYPRDYRCSCGRLLFRAILPPGSHVEVRCWHHQCSRMNIIALKYDIIAVENFSEHEND
jgi:hypothetical protein